MARFGQSHSGSNPSEHSLFKWGFFDQLGASNVLRALNAQTVVVAWRGFAAYAHSASLTHNPLMPSSTLGEGATSNTEENKGPTAMWALFLFMCFASFAPLGLQPGDF